LSKLIKEKDQFEKLLARVNKLIADIDMLLGELHHLLDDIAGQLAEALKKGEEETANFLKEA